MNVKTAMATGVVFCAVFLALARCATKYPEVFHDDKMDFSSVQSVAVMPFLNLTRDVTASERARDVFINKLLATKAVYVVPIGEVSRGVAKLEMLTPATPSPEEVVKLGAIVKVQAVVTGTLKEYGELRSGSSTGNAISMSMQMLETQEGKTVWSAATSEGGITIGDRLFGGGGKPMERITDKAIDDLLGKLFK